jgi:hypothetical protein
MQKENGRISEHGLFFNFQFSIFNFSMNFSQPLSVAKDLSGGLVR